MSPSADYAAMDSEYQVQRRSAEQNSPRRSSGSSKSHRPAAPKSFNGMHRRRAKRIIW